MNYVLGNNNKSLSLNLPSQNILILSLFLEPSTGMPQYSSLNQTSLLFFHFLSILFPFKTKYA